MCSLYDTVSCIATQGVMPEPGDRNAEASPACVCYKKCVCYSTRINEYKSKEEVKVTGIPMNLKPLNFARTILCNKA